jgi:beta-glucosidase
MKNKRVEELLIKMTLPEKIGQMTLFTDNWAQTGASTEPDFRRYLAEGRCGAIFNAYTADYTRSLQKVAVEQTRLGIPLLFGFDVIHGHRTIFPIPLAEACSWDMKLMEKSARIAATEAAAEGIHWVFAPMVDICRDPRWGRVAEGAGEDVWLACRIAEARVRGFQGNDLAATDTVLACAKHFAAYGAAEAGRDYNGADISERTLTEVYLPPFKACVEAGVRSFMPAFNETGGIPCTANRALLTDLLRTEWGFDGVVVTDYTAINELIAHGVAADSRQAALLAVLAGNDMDMQSGAFLQHLEELVAAGLVDISLIDAAVRRILHLKLELGLFDDPYRYCCAKREKQFALAPEHQQAALQMARSAMVLLQNTGGVLPFSKTLKSLAVIGPLADAKADLLGCWCAAGDGRLVPSVAEAICEKLGPEVSVSSVRGCAVNDLDSSGFTAALAAVQKADAVLLVLGESADMSGEAASRADIGLPGLQNQLAAAVMNAAKGKPVAAVLFNGRPLMLSELAKTVPAILEAWFPGSTGGQAVADIIFGDFNPSGKLVMSFPRHGGQIPIYYARKNTGRPVGPEKYSSKYLDVPNTPQFPFGHGLSYTSFSYGQPRLTTEQDSVAGRVVRAVVDVTNTGSRSGEEVVQLYLRLLHTPVTRPVLELKGCQKIHLSAGETRQVEFIITGTDLSFPGIDLQTTMQADSFELMIAGSSASP